MKKNRLFTFFTKMTICLSALFIYSCKKDLSKNFDKFTNPEMEKLQSKVEKWLDNQKKTANSHKLLVLENVRNNLAFESLHFEQLNDSEKLIIIPIAPGFKSEVNKNKTCINNLLLIEDPAGKIRKGNIVEFIPKNDPGLKSLPVNSFHQLYTNGKIDTDGRLAFLNLNDKLLYQMDYSNGRLTSYGEKQAGKPDDTKPGKGTSTNSWTSFIDWYLVTTYYYTDGSTEITSEYLYTTYYDDNYFETILYEIQNGDGIITETDTETIMSPKQVDWLVKDADACLTTNPANYFFEVWSTERLYGTKKAGEPGGGHFTKNEHLGDTIFGQSEFTWERTGATGAYTNSIARTTISGKINKSNSFFYLVQGVSHDFAFSAVFP